MTLPTGQIAYTDINNETGNPTTRSFGMDWVHDNTKPGQRAYDLNNVRGKAWYQKNNEGNCNNGNCFNCNNCNCGNIQCYNCLAVQCVNCANCDGRAWIQTNCNCACTYNCNQQIWSSNCDCACACDCGGNG